MSRRTRDERGSALIEFSWLAILLLVPLVWGILSIFEVQRGAFAVSAAARAAGRAYALAPDDATGAARAQSVADQVLADQGSPGQKAIVEVSCTSPAGNCHVGTAVITVRIHSRVALPLAPELLGKDTLTFALSSSHTVPIGQYVESAPDTDDAEGEDP